MTGQGVETQIYKKKYNLKIKALEQAISKMEIKELRELCHRYYENIDTLSKMVILPVILCSEEFMGHNYLMLSIEAMLASKPEKWEVQSEEEKKRYSEEIKRIWETKYRPKGKQLARDAAKMGVDKFSYVLKEPDVYKSYRSLLYSAIVFVWCGFEIFMKDLWEISLNMAGKSVKKMALGNIGKIEDNDSYSGIRGKYVNLDYLGQYNFNISNKLGSILVNKFDFTSPYGIKEAFLCLFPKSTVIKEALENEGLIQLEARRSLIVHRAGVIDAAFCKKTKISKKEMGTYLYLSDEEVFEYGNVTMDVVSKIVPAVSASLASRKKN